MIKYHDQTRGGKGLFILCFQIIFNHQTKSEQGLTAGTWRQKLMGRQWRMLLTGSSSWLAQPAFLENPGAASPGMDGTTHNGLGPPHQSPSNKMSSRLAYSPSHLLSWGSLLSDISSLCWDDIKLASMVIKTFPISWGSRGVKMVTQTFSLSIWGDWSRQIFEASLVYWVSSRTAKATQKGGRYGGNLVLRVRGDMRGLGK